jgi:hypothetical protein
LKCGAREDDVEALAVFMEHPVRDVGDSPRALRPGGAGFFDHRGGVVNTEDGGAGPPFGADIGAVAGAAAEIGDAARVGELDSLGKIVRRARAEGGIAKILGWIPGGHRPQGSNGD